MHPLPNAVMTVIMAVLTLYWFFVFISGVGLDDMDLGFDFDIDVPQPDAPEIEADVDGDSDGDVSQHESPGFFMKFLAFLNVGRVPFMLIFSTWKFLGWIGTLITTQMVDVSEWGAWSLLILIPLLSVALLFTKIFTNPLAKLFEEVGYKGEKEIDFLGRSGKMLSHIQGEKIGSAEVIINKDPIRLNVKSIDGSELNYGDYILIADESADKRFYLVSKEVTLRNF